jgi:hypothetical protein
MSALGQKQTWRPEITMSALPPEPDMAEGGRHVSFGPIADVVFLAVTPRGPQAIFDLYSIFIMPMGFPSGIHMHLSAHQPQYQLSASER